MQQSFTQLVKKSHLLCYPVIYYCTLTFWTLSIILYLFEIMFWILDCLCTCVKSLLSLNLISGPSPCLQTLIYHGHKLPKAYSLLCSQQPTTGSNPELLQPSLQFSHHLSSMNHFLIFSHLQI